MVTYGQFCPVAKASEVLTERWTPLIVREMLCGSTRFNEIRRGVPTISTALLTTRLGQLCRSGVAHKVGSGRTTHYELTEAGRELYPIIEALGTWGQRWARSEYGPAELDSSLLMWDIRRFLQPGGLGGLGGTPPSSGSRSAVVPVRVTVEFQLRVGRALDRYWLVVDDRGVDLCMVDPGFDADLVVTGTLRGLTEVWMGDQTMRQAVAAGVLQLNGSRALVRQFPDWLGQHPVLAPVGRADASPAATMPGAAPSSRSGR
ncbi:MAG: yybR 3 [Ilumatobacteraceae bacterium]|nr:yybR 3 [Ilumatobacteraceae bacterium]